MPESERGLTKRWRCAAETTSPLGLVDRVLSARSLVGPEAAEFLKPSLSTLHDPSLIPDLDRAAERLLKAATGGERIVIYGDYDVDGITATAILFHTLRLINPASAVTTYVPHRLDEGYGLNTDAISTLAAQGARVIVSVDCGITAIEPAAAAKSLGVDLIITDHHNPPASDADLPDAYAVVHPRRPGSAYPFGELCGAGVAYKLAWRMATLHCGTERVTKPFRTLLLDLLALAALGTIADIVPLVGENRVLTSFGLPMIKRSPLQGLQALVRAAGLDGEQIDADAVGFRLAPRLNACGRMGHAADAVRLFTTADADESDEIAKRLCTLNDDRRKTEREIFAQAVELAEAAGMTGPDRRAIVLAHRDWHPGVVGIVCSRLIERFGRPTILMQHQGDTCKGSGRSIDGFNLHAALETCSEHLLTFGGHDMAAGLSLDSGSLDAFTEAFTAHANSRLCPNDLMPTATYDCDATLAELTPEAIRSLDALAPFGRGNPRVRLRVRGLRLAGRPETFGKTGSHLSLRLEDRSSGAAVRAIAWGWADQRDRIPAGASLDALVVPKVSVWRGRTRIEPEIVDVMLTTSPVNPRSEPSRMSLGSPAGA